MQNHTKNQVKSILMNKMALRFAGLGSFVEGAEQVGVRLAMSVTSFELFEALIIAVGERRAMSLSVLGGRNRRVRGDEDLAHGRESSIRG